MPWINEFHYDNAGADAGEYIEIAGLAGTNLTGWQLSSTTAIHRSGLPTATINLSGIIADQQNGFGTLQFPAVGLQNGGTGSGGEPDGIALVDPVGNVIEFISYEGSFVAANGPAVGLASTNVGVGIFESGSVNGTAIGRVGTGDEAADFSWALIADDTPGGVNIGQTFEGGIVITASVGDVSLVEGDSGTSNAVFTITLSAASSSAVVIHYVTANGSAEAGSDYEPISDSVIILGR